MGGIRGSKYLYVIPQQRCWLSTTRYSLHWIGYNAFEAGYRVAYSRGAILSHLKLQKPIEQMH